jgi:hypothetical protein
MSYLGMAIGFVVAWWGWHGLRNGRETRWTLGAFLVGLVIFAISFIEATRQ